jgi:hypothetical protein
LRLVFFPNDISGGHGKLNELRQNPPDKLNFEHLLHRAYHIGMARKQDEQYTPEETARRRDEAIRRALNTPPKPHSEIAGKSGRKRLAPAKSRPAKKQ